MLIALSLPAAVPAAATPTSVLMIGDSITAGSSSEPAGPPYRLLLADALGAGYEVTHIACGGTSSRDWTLTPCGGSTGGSTAFRAACDESISLPIHPRLAGAAVERVCEVIRNGVG